MDDMLIIIWILLKHQLHLKKSLQLLLEKQLYAKARNCSFFLADNQFVIVARFRMWDSTRSSKFGEMRRWPLYLCTVTDVQKFLRIASY